MNPRVRLFVVTIWLLLSATFFPVAEAAVMDHGSYVADTSTGLDWYKVTNTAGLSYADVLDNLDSDLAGWRYATREELSALLAVFGLPAVVPDSLNTTVDPAIRAAIRDFAALLGNTLINHPVSEYWYGVIGFYDPPAPDPDVGQRVSIYFAYDVTAPDQNYATYASNNNVAALWVSDPIYGSFLVRSSVPEPGTLALLGLGLAGLAAARRRKQSH